MINDDLCKFFNNVVKEINDYFDKVFDKVDGKELLKMGFILTLYDELTSFKNKSYKVINQLREQVIGDEKKCH